jgi:hypothetical protein
MDEVAQTYMKKVNSEFNNMEEEYDFENPVPIDLNSSIDFTGKRAHPTFKQLDILDSAGAARRKFETGEKLSIRLHFHSEFYELPNYFTIFFTNEFGERVMVVYSLHNERTLESRRTGTIQCIIPELRLVTGVYKISVDFGVVNDGDLIIKDWLPDVAQIKVELGNYLGQKGLLKNQGVFAQKTEWQYVD